MMGSREGMVILRDDQRIWRIFGTWKKELCCFPPILIIYFFQLVV